MGIGFTQFSNAYLRSTIIQFQNVSMILCWRKQFTNCMKLSSASTALCQASGKIRIEASAGCPIGFTTFSGTKILVLQTSIVHLDLRVSLSELQCCGGYVLLCNNLSCNRLFSTTTSVASKFSFSYEFVAFWTDWQVVPLK